MTFHSFLSLFLFSGTKNLAKCTLRLFVETFYQSGRSLRSRNCFSRIWHLTIQTRVFRFWIREPRFNKLGQNWPEISLLIEFGWDTTFVRVLWGKDALKYSSRNCIWWLKSLILAGWGRRGSTEHRGNNRASRPAATGSILSVPKISLGI